MFRCIAGLLATGFLSACDGQQEEPGIVPDPTELIILAAPLSGDAYYADVHDDIIDFQIGFGRRILRAGDDVIVLADETIAPQFGAALGDRHVAVYPVEDIWARDFGSSNAEEPVFFRYTAAGQGGGQRDADAVQSAFLELAAEAGLDIEVAAALNDGGNLVDDYSGSLVVSRKFLRDNNRGEAAGRRLLQRLTGANHIAFIEADEQGGLEHADGVVSFIGPNTLVINSYPEDPDYAASLRAAIEDGLPGVEIHQIATPYDGNDIYDARFGSACGLYTNSLVTPHRIYLPQFGIAEDEVVLAHVRSLTDRDVVPVPSAGVCHMGGGVRCMSWQLRGETARALAAHLRDLP
ncbi:agmatine deiminase family protein [Hyphobacterium sp.]|uniref:agmatine deiminase family protein n=1 Tax=Hyphobacterium sp. TaxID=2004662 RepID=UPI003B526606